MKIKFNRMMMSSIQLKFKKFIAQCDLETKSKTFKVIDLKGEKNLDV